MNERRQKQYVSLENARKRVARGAAYLDKHFKSGKWRKRINASDLSISTYSHCTLGLLFGDYYTGIKTFGWNPIKGKGAKTMLRFRRKASPAVRKGFMGGADPNFEEEEYDNLQTAWKEELQRSDA